MSVVTVCFMHAPDVRIVNWGWVRVVARIRLSVEEAASACAACCCETSEDVVLLVAIHVSSTLVSS